jgi:hypothetical protein
MSTSQPLSAVAPCFHPRKRTSKPPVASASYNSSSDGALPFGARHSVRVLPPAAQAAVLADTPRPPPPPPFRSSHYCAPQPKWFSQRKLGTTGVAIPASSATAVKESTSAAATNNSSRRCAKKQTVTPSASAKSHDQPHSAPSGEAPYAFTLSSLSDELHDFVEYVTLNADEQISRRDLIHEVEEAAFSLWGATTQARVVVYGSYALGVSLPTSDVDMAVVFRPLPELSSGSSAAKSATHGESNIAVMTMSTHDLLCRLHQLSKKLNESPLLRCSVIEQCRVPVVHIEDTWSGMSGDVSMSVPDLDAVVSMQKAWLRNNSPLAKELIVVTKAALKQWGLNSSFTGGLSSTCVYLLVQRFLAEQEVLQTCKHNQATDERHKMLAHVLRNGKEEHESLCTSPSSLSCGISSPGAETESTTTATTTPRATGMSSPSLSLGGEVSRAPSMCGGDDEEVHQPNPYLSRVSSPSQCRLGSTSRGVCDDSIEISGPSSNGTNELFAKTLLAFWKYCGHDVFATGYEVSNTFLPTVEQLLTAEHSDLSRGAFRLAEVQMLFKHSVGVLEQLVAATHTTFAGMFNARPPTPLSAILTDPRAAPQHQPVSTQRRKRNDHY